MMFVIAVTLMGGLFVNENAEFFNDVEQNRKDGKVWEYVGPQSPNEDESSIPLISKDGGETVYFKMQ
jgi:hypothetical protein|tara:strand:+ start:1477 stop:1677 length:201 start_codon:yes stop_codon:yes gene_type:complete